MSRSHSAAMLVAVSVLLFALAPGARGDAPPLHLPLILRQHVSTAAPTATATLTPTRTPTSLPVEPFLFTPADGATLPQPVPPDRWSFMWTCVPCGPLLHLHGPQGSELTLPPDNVTSPFTATYTQTAPLPDEALGPWHWWVSNECEGVVYTSPTRSFWVRPAATLTPTPTATATPTRPG